MSDEQTKRSVRSLARVTAQKFPGLSEADILAVADLHADGAVLHEDGRILTEAGTDMTELLNFVFASKVGANTESKVAKADDDRAKYGGYTEADFKALPFHQQHAILEEVAGKSQAVESWRKNNAPVSVGEIVQRTGLSAEAFAALPVERRLEIESEVKFSRGVRS